jgi:hypothetical protein
VVNNQWSPNAKYKHLVANYKSNLESCQAASSANKVLFSQLKKVRLFGQLQKFKATFEQLASGQKSKFSVILTYLFVVKSIPLRSILLVVGFVEQ